MYVIYALLRLSASHLSHIKTRRPCLSLCASHRKLLRPPPPPGVMTSGVPVPFPNISKDISTPLILTISLS